MSMKGLELAEAFYRTWGAPMLHEQFPELEAVVAVGLAGSGSECFGYDDEISRDHDFEPGFCLFLPDEAAVDRRTAFALERAYAKLPREFMGFRRLPLDPVGGNRHGVIRMGDFFEKKTGHPEGRLSLREWIAVPEQSLAEATNGIVFRDDRGELTAIRQRLAYLPEDARLKKLAGCLLMMGQAGQYNYPRCIARGETAAAQLAVAEFVNHALHAVFLLNRRYLPYYKWSFRALRELPRGDEWSRSLEELLLSDNSQGQARRKTERIEAVCLALSEALRAQGLTDRQDGNAEAHAYEVNRRIKDGTLRTLHILFAV